MVSESGLVLLTASGRLMLAEKVSEAVQSISEHFEGLQEDYGKSLFGERASPSPYLAELGLSMPA